MSARTTVTTEVIASPPPGVATPSGQAFILGATQTGPIDAPVEITGLAQFKSVFGERSGGTATFDLIEGAFKEGLGSCWVQRVAGPDAEAATRTVGGLTVTATSVGAWGNAVAVQWTNSTKILTVAGVQYPAPTVASLQAALAYAGAPVTVSGSLPTNDVASGSLSGGTDDAGNADLAALLDKFAKDLGDGAVVVVGESAAEIAEDLAAHCEATSRQGLIAAESGSTLAEATLELADVPSEFCTLVWPDTTAGAKVYPATAQALGSRARAHASGRVVQSPIAPAYGNARFMDGLLTEVSDSEWITANAAGLSVIRKQAGQVCLFGWRSAAAPNGVLTLQGANYRDLINRVQVGAQQVADNFRGQIIDGQGVALADFGARLVGFMESLKGNFFAAPNDPGYVVDVGPDVNTAEDIAAGRITANVSFRAAGTAEFFTIAIVATDAAGVL